MAQWYGNDPDTQIDPYKLRLPNVTISEVVKPANNNAETDSEDFHGDYYIDAVPEVMISDDVERTDFFEQLNLSHLMGKRPMTVAGPRCCALGCMSTSAKNRKGQRRKAFFPFPQDPERAAEWARKTGSANFLDAIVHNPELFWLCNDHFESSMFILKDSGSELLPNAVPSEALLSQLQHDIHVPYNARRPAVMTVYCPDCGKGFRDKFNLRKHMSKANKCTDPERRWKGGQGKAGNKTAANTSSPSGSPSVSVKTDPLELESGDPVPIPAPSTPRTKKPRVSCNVCGKSLGDAWKLKRHLSSLNKCVSRAWKCGACEVEFKTELELLGHITSHPEDEQSKARDGLAYAERGVPRPTTFPCLKCGTVFNDKWKLIRHNQRKLKCTAPKGEYHCSECDKVYLKRQEWRQHVQEQHTVEIYTGTQIKSENEDHSGTDGETSQNGVDSDGKVEVWTCSVCCAIFSKLDHLKRHCSCVHHHLDWSETDWEQFIEKVDHNEENGKMEVGVRGDDDSPNKSQERRSGSGIVIKDGFECSRCLKKFSRRDHLKRHNDQFHPGEYGFAAKKHVCDICEHAARDAWSLKKHKKSHYTPSSAKMKRSWQCTLCGVFLSKSVDAELHLSKHSDAMSAKEGGGLVGPVNPPIKIKIRLRNPTNELTDRPSVIPVNANIVHPFVKVRSDLVQGLQSKIVDIDLPDEASVSVKSEPGDIDPLAVDPRSSDVSRSAASDVSEPKEPVSENGDRNGFSEIDSDDENEELLENPLTEVSIQDPASASSVH